MSGYKVIMHEQRDMETDIPLFWSNEDGWVSLSDATLFEVDEEVRLPREAWGSVELPVPGIQGRHAETKAPLLSDDQLASLQSILMQHVEDCDSEAGGVVDDLWQRINDATAPEKTLYRAYAETRDFEFEGYGATEEEARETCYAGWLRHCRAYRPEGEIDPDHVTRDDIGVYAVTVGVAYRDRETMKEKDPG